MNPRDKERFNVNLACIFHKSGQRYAGRVRNMSRNGLLTVWGGSEAGLANLKTGDEWQIEIELPAYHQFAPNAFNCQAVVMRVTSEADEEQEVAFRIDRMTAADLKAKTKQTVAAGSFVM